MTKEEEEETGTASRGGEWKNREANDIVKVHDIPEKMTAANSPKSILCSALSASHLQASPLNVNQRVIPKPSLCYTQSPRPHLVLLSNVLTLLLPQHVPGGEP